MAISYVKHCPGIAHLEHAAKCVGGRMFSLEGIFGCAFSQLELDMSAQVRNHDIVHARV